MLDLIIIQDVYDFFPDFFFSNLGHCLPDPFDLDVAALVLEAFESITHIVKQILLLVGLNIIVLFYFSDERDYIIGEMMSEFLAGCVDSLDKEGNYVEIMRVKIPEGVFVLCYPVK